MLLSSVVPARQKYEESRWHGQSSCRCLEVCAFQVESTLELLDRDAQRFLAERPTGQWVVGYKASKLLLVWMTDDVGVRLLESL